MEELVISRIAFLRENLKNSGVLLHADCQYMIELLSSFVAKLYCQSCRTLYPVVFSNLKFVRDALNRTLGYLRSFHGESSYDSFRNDEDIIGIVKCLDIVVRNKKFLIGYCKCFKWKVCNGTHDEGVSVVSYVTKGILLSADLNETGLCSGGSSEQNGNVQVNNQPSSDCVKTDIIACCAQVPFKEETENHSAALLALVAQDESDTEESMNSCIASNEMDAALPFDNLSDSDILTVKTAVERELKSICEQDVVETDELLMACFEESDEELPQCDEVSTFSAITLDPVKAGSAVSGVHKVVTNLINTESPQAVEAEPELSDVQTVITKLLDTLMGESNLICNDCDTDNKNLNCVICANDKFLQENYGGIVTKEDGDSDSNEDDGHVENKEDDGHADMADCDCDSSDNCSEDSQICGADFVIGAKKRRKVETYESDSPGSLRDFVVSDSDISSDGQDDDEDESSRHAYESILQGTKMTVKRKRVKNIDDDDD